MVSHSSCLLPLLRLCAAGALTIILSGSECPSDQLDPPALDAVVFETVDPVEEGDEGGQPVVVPIGYVRLAGTSSKTVRITWTLESLTATMGEDFAMTGGSASGHLVLGPTGDLMVVVVNLPGLEVLGDLDDEENETFQLTLTEPMDMGLAGHPDGVPMPMEMPDPLVITITDDDGPPSSSQFVTGTFAGPSSPEGGAIMPGGWGPRRPGGGPELWLANGDGVTILDPTQSPPAVIPPGELFIGATLPTPCWGIVPLAPGSTRRSQAADGQDLAFLFGAGGYVSQAYDHAVPSYGMTVTQPGYIPDAVAIGGGILLGLVWVQGGFTVRTMSYDEAGETWDASVFMASPAYAASAYEHQVGGPVLIVGSGAADSLYVKSSPSSEDDPVAIGPLGDDPRRIRFVSPIGAVSNFATGDLTIFTWDGSSLTPVIVGQVEVGDGPMGIDLIETGGNVAVVSTGYNDHTYNVTVLTPAGDVVSNVTTPAPAGVLNPGHAIFARDEVSTKIVITGNGSDNFAIIESGF